MARKQAADYEERREAIIEKAAGLFAKTGFLGTSVAGLAEACKTSKSLIYHYYPSKEDILFAVMMSHLDQLSEDVTDVMAVSGTSSTRLQSLVRRFMGHYAGAAHRQKVLLNELDNLPKDRRAEIVAKQQVIIDIVRDLLIDIKPELAADRPRARVQTMLLFGMINWTHTWFNPRGVISPDALAEMASGLIMSRSEPTSVTDPEPKRIGKDMGGRTPVRRRSRG